jgi:hypothetical protein
MYASWFYLIALYFAGVDTLPSAVRVPLTLTILTPAFKQADRIKSSPQIRKLFALQA